MKATEFWQGILGQLEVEVPQHVYKTWLSETRGHALTDDSLTVAVPSPFIAECLEKRMYQIIHKTVERVNSRSLDIHFKIPDSNDGSPVVTKMGVKSAPNYPTAGHLGSALNSRYTFDSFVVGPSNDLAYSGAQSVASHPGKTYNPLFVYSDVGLGKTHLLQAIGHQCNAAGLSFIYVTGISNNDPSASNKNNINCNVNVLFIFLFSQLTTLDENKPIVTIKTSVSNHWLCKS